MQTVVCFVFTHYTMGRLVSNYQAVATDPQILREMQWREFEMFVVQFALLDSRGNQTPARKKIC